MVSFPILTRELAFPHPATAVNGLVALGGDLSVERLLLAYRMGIFPWSATPITWWSPNPRAIFDLDNIHVTRSLRRSMRQQAFRFTINQAFSSVIRACANAPRRGDATWIDPEIVLAYEALHESGHAHSIECWLGDRLVGGLYGVAVGGLFAGESMFHHVPDASKAVVVVLAAHLRRQGFDLFDTQMLTETTERLGAFEIPREEYLWRLERAVQYTCHFQSESPDILSDPQ